MSVAMLAECHPTDGIPRLGARGHGCPALRCRYLTRAGRHIDTNKVRTSVLLILSETNASAI
jgi:hypothetical protein